MLEQHSQMLCFIVAVTVVMDSVCSAFIVAHL